MVKIDLKAARPDLYRPGAKDFTEVLVPPIRYLAVDGHGDPNTAPEYASAVEALFAVGYSVKFALRGRTGDDIVAGPLEGLWSSPDPTAFADRRKTQWDWTMLIPLPDVVSDEDIDAGRASAAAKKPGVRVADVRVLDLDEGRCLQIMHIGSYDEEAPTLSRLHHEVMPALGVTWNGPHHEIYLGDPRRTPAERLKTVLRQPVRPLEG
ncbi:MAG: GyrI-like domain-containing protein [Propionibacteriaceae bacterium]